MAKYIKAEEVKAIITGYIQRDINLKKGFDLVHDTMAICETIDKMATDDVVEVIRCKDCNHYISGFCTRDINGRTNMFRMSEDDFCSCGERKDEK